jgi:hypothetical protein
VRLDSARRNPALVCDCSGASTGSKPAPDRAAAEVARNGRWTVGDDAKRSFASFS